MKNLALSLTFGFIIVAVLFLTRLVDPVNTSYLYTLVYSAFSIVPIIMCLYVIKKFHFKGIRLKVLLFLVSGAMSFILGDILVFSYIIISGEIPYPSLADLFYFLGYILFPIGIIIELNSNRDKLTSLPSKRVAFLVLLSVVFSLIALYLWFQFMYSPQTPYLQNLVSFGYILGDIIQIIGGVLVLAITYIYKGGKINRTWIYIFILFMTLFFADIVYIIYNTNYETGLYPVRQFSDLLYLLVYFFLGLSFISLGDSLLSIQSKLQKI